MLDVAIVGAGFGGLAMAQALQRQGRLDFVVLEKAHTVGGTWRENTYPGAACDVPGHLYSLAQAPNPGWSRLFPQQAEIQAHLEAMAAPLRAQERLRFDWTLGSAIWDSDAACWVLHSRAGASLRARHLVLALGGLHVPHWPEIAGREGFAGTQFHSAQWRHDHALQGRRVGVIGSGASAVQFVPQIAGQVAHLSVFQRTPNWLIPRPDVALPGWLQRSFVRLPALRLALRGAIFLLLELLSSALTHRRTAFWGRALGRWHLRRQVADLTLRAQLTPHYAFGCKRVLIASDYYPALQLPQVACISDPIAAIEPLGVRLASGRMVELDTLIYATGFKPMDVLADLAIHGRDGHELRIDWQRRPHAHLGINVPGYPNLHLLLGPNTALGHNSVLYMIESQVQHILLALQACADRAARALEPTPEAAQRWMQRVDAGFPSSAWAGGCHSWYLDDAGQNIALWTASCLAYRRLTRRLQPQDYQFLT